MHKVTTQNSKGTSLSPDPSVGFEQTRCCRAHNKPNDTLIHILDDDSLLNIFCFCRPVVWDKEGAPAPRILEGGEWTRERWWYKLVHVCQRWRYLILGSASHLDLSLVCPRATPVAGMLGNSPHLSHLPLIIDYLDERHDATTELEGILFALRHRDRVRRIRLRMSVPNLQKLVVAIDDEFPLLEYLYITPVAQDNTSLTLSGTFQAPHLRHLILENFALPIGSPLLTTAVGLVTLSLNNVPLSSYFHPNDLIHRVSLMPQLETLGIYPSCPIPALDIERLPLRMPIKTHVTLPNLRWFGFMGASAYLEVILPRITTPLLEKLQIEIFPQPTSPVTHLSQFMSSTESLRFNSINLAFYKKHFTLRVYPREGANMFSYALWLQIHSNQPDGQVASAARILNTLSTALSTAEHLTLKRDAESHEEAHPMQWRELLMSLGNLKTLRVSDGLVGEVSRYLRSDDTEPPMELLPELKVLEYTATDDTGDAFASFIDARKNAGHPVALVHR